VGPEGGRREQLGYRPSLDGLRAFAIVAVVVLHFSGDRWLPGGWLGVNLFFVLSGFLITRLLIEEHEAIRAVNLRAFYQRRAARLVPALVAMCLTVGALALVTNAFTGSVGPGLISSLTYTSNWFAIARGWNALGPFVAMWSLALEEQYYILWALALVCLMRVLPRRALGWCAGVATAFLFVALAVRFSAGVNGVALYSGTFGQGMGFLLAGSVLGIALPLGTELASSRVADAVRVFWGPAVAVVVLFVVFFAPGDSRAHYATGGLALLAACMVVIVVAALLDTPLARIARTRPLVYIGRRSYAIYLWHVAVYDIVIWARPTWNAPLTGIAAAILTMIIATVSWRWLEQPLRRKLRPAGAEARPLLRV
jgi:peptidoglycan/LPS O-acetylase OafA/YrhL